MTTLIAAATPDVSVVSVAIKALASGITAALPTIVLCALSMATLRFGGEWLVSVFKSYAGETSSRDDEARRNDPTEFGWTGAERHEEDGVEWWEVSHEDGHVRTFGSQEEMEAWERSGAFRDPVRDDETDAEQYFAAERDVEPGLSGYDLMEQYGWRGDHIDGDRIVVDHQDGSSVSFGSYDELNAWFDRGGFMEGREAVEEDAD